MYRRGKALETMKYDTYGSWKMCKVKCSVDGKLKGENIEKMEKMLKQNIKR